MSFNYKMFTVLVKCIEEVPFFQSTRADMDEQTLNVLEEQLTDLGVDGGIVYDYDTVTWNTISVNGDLYKEILINTGNSNNVETGLFVWSTNSEYDLNIFFIKNLDFKIENTVKKRRKRKSIKDLQNELSKAVKEENYEKAEKLKKKIEYKKNFIKKNNNKNE